MEIPHKLNPPARCAAGGALALAASLTILLANGACGAPQARSAEAEPAPPAPAAPAAADATTSAPTTQPAASADDALATAPKPAFLWQIEGPNGPSYLFGTMHGGVHPDKDLPAAVWERFEGASIVVVEADVRAAITAMSGDTTQLMLPAGETLEQKLSADEWQRLVAYMADTLPELLLKRFKPSSVVSMMTTKALPSTPSIDMTIIARAQEAKKEMVYLEDWRAQMALFDDIVKIDTLRYILDDLEQFERDSAEMVAIYTSGDEDRLAEFMRDPARYPSGTDEATLERLLFERNRSWIAELEKQINRGGAFIAVGAGHLAGTDSVNQLLAARGFTITRLASP
ncbi:MAG: TraB/GumN family protein [Haliangiales bacterium]